MQKFTRLKQFVALLGFLLPAVWCGANDTYSMDGYSSIIIIKVGIVTTPCTDHWLFYYYGPDSNEPCISWEELNCYWANINAEVVNETAPLHYHSFYLSNIPYFEAEVKDEIVPEAYDTVSKLHNLKVTYSDYYWYNPSI